MLLSGRIHPKLEWSECDQTLLHSLVYKGDYNYIRLVLLEGEDVNIYNGRGETALHCACETGNLKCINALLEYEPDINILDRNNRTPLNVFLGHMERRHAHDPEKTLRRLLNAGANPLLQSSYGIAPLHIVSKYRLAKLRTRFAEILISYGADVNVKNQLGYTPLHIALLTGYPDIVKIFLKNGADINIRDTLDLTSVDMALISTLRNQTILEELGKHIIRLQVYNKSANEKELDQICKVVNLKKFQEDCKEELSNLKNFKFGDFNVSHYDILMSSRNRIAKYMQNHALLNLLMTSINKKVDIFRDNLTQKISVGLKRHQAFTSGYKFLEAVIPSLPDLCKKNLMEYLENDDLRNMEGAVPKSK